MKTTRGPWKVLSYHPTNKKDEAIIVGPQMEARPPIAKCHPDNANLIAAAPDLLIACENARAWMDADTKNGTSITASMIVQKIAAAIAKAKGQ